MDMLGAIEHIKDQFRGDAILEVWSEYQSPVAIRKLGHTLSISIGMCSRDSGNVLKDTKRFPYLRDVLRNGPFNARRKRMTSGFYSRGMTLKSSSCTR